MTYDSDNLFAKMLRGEIPCHKVYEDEDVLAFMDIFPQSKGHTLVIPKTEAANLFEIEPEWLGKLAIKTQKVAKGVRAALQPDGVRIMQFNGQAAGQTVFHIHFHIIPKWEGKALAPHGGTAARADDAELAELATLINAAL